MSIHKKILAVQQAVERIPKNGRNDYNKYNYATEADVLKVKELMNNNGLIVFPDVVNHEIFNRGDSVQVILHVEYTVVDVETGELIKIRVVGQGEDKGDKGAYKAATGANKYFYLKFAGCSTGDDPENESGSGGGGYRGRGNPAPARQYQKSAPQRQPQNVTPINQAGKVSPTLNKILKIQKQEGLTNAQLAKICEVSTLKGLAPMDLEAALEKLERAVTEAYSKIALPYTFDQNLDYNPDYDPESD